VLQQQQQQLLNYKLYFFITLPLSLQHIYSQNLTTIYTSFIAAAAAAATQ
jgi:hypothetical protein